MNSCSFIGRVGKDAVVRNTSGDPVVGWPIAVDVGFGDRKSTLWIDCSLWGKRAEKVAEYILKGDNIGVHGEVGTREHDGKTYLTLRVANVTLLGKKRDGANEQRAPARQAPASPADDFADDDIPF